MVLLGQPVADGLQESKHVTKQRLYPYRGEPICIGYEFGLTPTAVLGQNLDGRIPIFAALPCVRGGVRQHMRDEVLPWISRHAPWALMDWRNVIGRYDPAGDTPVQSDINESPAQVLREMLPGDWQLGAVS